MRTKSGAVGDDVVSATPCEKVYCVGSVGETADCHLVKTAATYRQPFWRISVVQQSTYIMNIVLVVVSLVCSILPLCSASSQAESENYCGACSPGRDGVHGYDGRDGSPGTVEMESRAEMECLGSAPDKQNKTRRLHN